MIHHNKNGFTLVELMLSMAFVSVLLLAIALLIMQIGLIYNKGLTLRAVNEAGQVITSDIQRTLNTARPLETKLVSDGTPTTGARLCAGTSVYAWNYGEYLQDSSPFNRYTSKSDEIRLVKFDKGAVDYCALAVDGQYPRVPDAASTLLSPGDSNLALHSFTTNQDVDSSPGQPVSGDASQRLYLIDMVIGTNEASVIAGNGCRVPESRIDDQYCAVNEFSFSARAGNK